MKQLAFLLLIPSILTAQELAIPAGCSGIECLVAHSESKGKPCQTNLKNLDSDAGGLSIGAYQMSSRYGNAQKLLDWMSIDMEGLDPQKHAEAYAARFEAICSRNPDYFLSQQTEYLLQAWPEWQRAKRRYEGLEGLSEPLKALALSVVVSHGYEGSKSILEPLRGPLPELSEAELAKAISLARACAWGDVGGPNMKGWAYRANREYKWVMERLGEPNKNLEVKCDG